MRIIDEKYSNAIRQASGQIAADSTSGDDAGRPDVAKRANLWRRIVAAITAAHQRQMDRDLARIIVRSGGRLTDAVEGEIMRRQSARESGFGTEDTAKRLKDDKPLAPLGWF